MVRVLFLFLTCFHVNVARSNGNPTWRAKINACVLCVRVLYKTRRSFIRSFSRLSQDLSYLRTGAKGCSKIRRVLAKPRLILDEMCRLYGVFASYLRRVLCKTSLIFPRINGPVMQLRKESLKKFRLAGSRTRTSVIPVQRCNQ